MHAVAFVERLWPGGQAVLDDTLPRLISRSLSAGLGTASVPLVFLIGRRLFSTRAGLLASGFLAIAFLHVRDSHFGVTDVPMTFMVLLAFLVIVSMPMDRAPWWMAALAAVVCGLATSTKYNAALIIAPLLIAVWQRNGDRWMYVIDRGRFRRRLPRRHAVRTDCAPEVLRRSRRDCSRILSGGHAIDEGVGWIHHLTFSLRYGLGLPLLLTALAGLVWLIADDRRAACVVLAISRPVLPRDGIGPDSLHAAHDAAHPVRDAPCGIRCRSSGVKAVDAGRVVSNAVLFDCRRFRGRDRVRQRDSGSRTGSAPVRAGQSNGCGGLHEGKLFPPRRVGLPERLRVRTGTTRARGNLSRAAHPTGCR